MRKSERGRGGKAVAGALALAVVAVLMSASSASAATFSNVCLNTASTDPNTAATALPVDMTANSPATVAPGDPVTLSNIDQTLTVPATIFVTGYNLGLVLPGQPPAVTPTEAVIDATAQTDVAATNTAEGVQTTNLAAGTVTTTITDPDGTRATGDETATPGALSVTYADLNWTAGGSAGTIDFREDTVSPISAGTETGALIAKAIIFPGVLTVTFACSPGSVSPNPGPAANIVYDDPAVAFASTEIVEAVNQPPVANAGADQTVASEQAGVTLDGSGSTDPDGDPITYSWTQTSGPAVTLSGADTATPSFDAPVGPATLEFQLEVCDAEPLCDTDTVVVNVSAPVIQVVDAGAELIVNGPTRSAATKKGFVVRVTNLGTGPITIDPAIDTSAEVTVNGAPAGSVELKSTNSKTLDPGARTRFRYQWNLEGSAAPGDTVVYSGTVSVADDADPGNDTDSATATAR